MRGKGVIVQNYCISSRITPAYAGKRVVVGIVAILSRDHPRLCGEKVQTASGIAPMTGSPPPMRGKAVLQTTFSHRHRITPAYAGKSLKRRMRQFGCQDHPRLCGEKQSNSQ